MNALIKKFGDEKRWILFRKEERKGKQTKVPYTITGKLASSTDEKTWSIYSDVESHLTAYDGAGIIFTPKQTLLGIDLDHVIENGKFLKEFLNLKKFVDEADTYVEISPSKSGLHLFFEITEPLKLEANRHDNVEAYSSGRYFTFTGNSFGAEKEVRAITPEEATALLKTIGYPWGKKTSSTVPADTASPLPDTTVIAKMFSSRNGEDIQKTYNGDLAAFNGNASSADMSLCSHLAFWTAKNAEQMERIWLASPLGNRQKTAGRKDYRVRTIEAAITNCDQVYESPTIATRNLDLLTQMRNKEEIPVPNTENVSRILNQHPEFKGMFRFDRFRMVYEMNSKCIEDSDAIYIQTRLQTLFKPFATIGKNLVYDGIMKACKDNEIDSAADWIKGLVWDKQDRLNSWIAKTYGTPDDEYHQKVGSNWLKGLVKRIMEPGSKFDYVLVLQGKQGIKKSTSLATLGGAWYVETAMGTENKDFFMQLQGKAIIEFSEGETLSRTEVKRMKAIITTQIDKFRPPYERSSQEFPRRCVFAMTTNDDQYLKDDTGNRRWLPVCVQQNADIEWLAENREQLFAEAYHRAIVLRETTYEFPDEAMLEAQRNAEMEDPRSEEIYDWYWQKLGDMEREAGITAIQAYKDGVQHGNSFGKEMGKYEQIIIGKVLKNSLKLERRRLRDDGILRYRYYETPESKATAPANYNKVADMAFADI